MHDQLIDEDGFLTRSGLEAIDPVVLADALCDGLDQIRDAPPGTEVVVHVPVSAWRRPGCNALVSVSRRPLARSRQPRGKASRKRGSRRGTSGGGDPDDGDGGDPPRSCVACGRPKCKGREKTCAACRKRAQRERERLAALREEMQAPELAVEAEPEPGAFEYSPLVWEWAMQTDGDGLPYTLPQRRKHRGFGSATDRGLVVA